MSPRFITLVLLLIVLNTPGFSAFAQNSTARTKALEDEHGQVISKVSQLSQAGKYLEALPYARRQVELAKLRFKPGDLGIAYNTEGLADILERLGRFSEAEVLYRVACDIVERSKDAGQLQLPYHLSKLARVQREIGDLGEAEKTSKRILALHEKAGSKDIESQLADLADIYLAQGRYMEAEELLKRVVQINERTVKELRVSHYTLAEAVYVEKLMKLGRFYSSFGRYNDAEPVLQKALASTERGWPNSMTTAGVLLELGKVYWAKGRNAEAEESFKKSLKIIENTSGPTHPDVAVVLTNLARVSASRGEPSAAESSYKQALAIEEKLLGAWHPRVGDSLQRLGNFYRAQDRIIEAEPLIRRSLEIEQRAYGNEHPSVVNRLDSLRALYESQGRIGPALDLARKAVSALSQAQAKGGVAPLVRSDIGEEWKRTGSYYFYELVRIANIASKGGLESASSLSGETFLAAQWASQSSTASAVSQMGARLVNRDSAVHDAVLNLERLVTRWRSLDRQLIQSMSAPHSRNQEREDRIRTELLGVERQLQQLDVRLMHDFPEYVEFARTRPVEVDKVQQLVSPEEVLVLMLVGSQETFVWAVTRQGVSWQRVGLGSKALADKVAALRSGLDCRAIKQAKHAGDCLPWQLPFNLDLAHELYRALLGPVADLIRDKRYIIIVPSGPLTSLPFSVLVTAPGTASEHYANYRDPAWLMKHHAITVLPSVSSLRALRALAKASRGDKPFVGFGDPIFSRGGTQPQRPGQIARARSFATYFKGRLADSDALALLDPLPETATELKAIARTLGVPESEIYLRERASESVVKGMKLDNYRVIHFATHGLVAGDVQGLAEPALALTVPRAPSESDDGLLTASEVAQLKLDADWVILSACNTAAGDKPGAEALSGLARAFFYAGARALLVSHWPVETNAAVKLTTRTFAEINANPGLARAEALRRAMIALMNDRDIRHAHPALWAPFMVVGESGPEQGGVPSLISGPTLQRSGSVPARE